MEMTEALFLHSANLHEAHKMFAESIDADFELAYTKELTGLRRSLEAFKRVKEYPEYPVYLLEGGMSMFPAYLRKRKEGKEENDKLFIDR